MSGRKRHLRRKNRKKTAAAGRRKQDGIISKELINKPRAKIKTRIRKPEFPSQAVTVTPPHQEIRTELIAPLPGEKKEIPAHPLWFYAVFFVIVSLGFFFLLPAERSDSGFFISSAAVAATAAFMIFMIVYSLKSRGKIAFSGYCALLLPVILSVFLAYYFNGKTSEGGIHVGLLPVPVTVKPRQDAAHRKKYGNDIYGDPTTRVMDRIMQTASTSGINRNKKKYFNDHVHMLFRNTGQLACEGKTASECLSAWQKRGFPAIKELPQANSITMQLIKDDDRVRISWAGNSPKLRLMQGDRLGRLCRPGNRDEKKLAAFAAAADMLITDKDVKKQVEDYYTGPSVSVDTAGAVAPFYMYYLACMFVFEYNTGGRKNYSPFLPPPAAGTAPDFLNMNEMFDRFMDKAAELDGLAALTDRNAGRIGQKQLKRYRQEASELSAEINANDTGTSEHFITLALKASLVAQQWAMMENSIQKNPWFETTYGRILNRALLGMFLETGIKPCRYTEQYEKFIAAAALMLYKTSKVMGTYKNNPKYMTYSDNYMIAHAILMHFMEEFDAALRESVAQELDRYYAGRYYGTVDY